MATRQLCFVGGQDGLFLAAACNDGGLPLFVVGSVDEEDEEVGTRRALMAIEPVEGVATAADERFKCIESVKGGSGFLVVTANSGGIISLIDLEGAARMLLDDNDENREDVTDDDSESISDTEDEDLAAEILNSVRIGSGARITAISVWSQAKDQEHEKEDLGDDDVDHEVFDTRDATANIEEDEALEEKEPPINKRKRMPEVSAGKKVDEIEMDQEAIKRARALVTQAKKHQKRKKSRNK